MNLGGLSLAALLGAGLALAAPQRPVEGNPMSPVRVIVYEDLQCPDCAVFRRMLDEKLLPRYGSKVAFEHRDFPLAKHAWARRASIAARFFDSKGAEPGIEYRRHTMATRAGITPENFNQRLAEFARAHGVDPAAAVAALNDAKLAALVDQDYEEGVARGVVHTPTAFVNGKPFVETFTFEEISKGIDEALAQAQ